MIVVRDDLWLCVDCLMVACNGEENGLDSPQAVREGVAALGPHLVPDFDSETGEGIEEFSRRGCDACGSALAGTMHRFAVLAENPQASEDFPGKRETCFFCGNGWGSCTCPTPEPDDFSGPSFDWEEFAVNDPGTSVCSRFFVDPEVYYGAPYLALRDAFAAAGWISDDDRTFDLFDLSGDATPVSLRAFLLENASFPPDPDEVKALRACAIGATVHLGIGGGSVVVRRVS